MSSIIAVLTAIVMAFTNTMAYEYMWNNASDDERKEFPLQVQAYACGMSETEFEYLARTIQAESNGTYDWSDLEDKILIACVVLNRVESSQFPDNISSVLSQDGQFTTTSGGWCYTSYCDSSKWAIVEAQRRIANDEVPDNLLYFNCIGYSGTPYTYEGGNYFSLG